MHTGTIPTFDELTSTWFTEMLRTEGSLDGSTSVIDVKLAAFGSEESVMSSLHRATLTYDGPTGAPDSLVVKLASDNETQRFVASLFKFYEREIRFYNEIAARMTIEVPRCYRADIDLEDHSFILVIELIEDHTSVDQIAGVGHADALTAIVELADLQAPHWGKDLDAEAETFLRFDSPLLRDVLPDHVAGDWSIARPKLIDELPPEIIELFDNLGSFMSELLERMHGTDTLCHGDFRSDNLLFDADRTVRVLDFQLGVVAHGITDLAYFISQSVDDTVTAERNADLIQAYVDRLATHGIELEMESAIDHYRAALVFYSSIPLGMLAFDTLPERGDRLARTMLRRLSSEILRTEAHLQFG